VDYLLKPTITPLKQRLEQGFVQKSAILFTLLFKKHLFCTEKMTKQTKLFE